MNASYHQKVDLIRFGNQVQRLLVTRIVTARNVGKIDTEQMKLLEELLPTPADVQLLLDNFESSLDVASALAELEPMLPLLQKAIMRSESDWKPALTNYRNRVRRAVEFLKS